jgi:ribosome-dependent ATPase
VDTAQPTPSGNAADPVVSIEDVTHQYGKVVALDHISLEIPSGLMVGVIGPDGVGKSTLLALIAGSKRLQHGNVTVLNGDIASARHRRAACPRIAYMPQGLGKNLYLELSVHDNVDFMAQLFGLTEAERRIRITELLAATGLAPFHGRPAGKLSGGMKQKLALMCTLLHRPEILFLDEPTNGVDPVSRRDFWAILYQLLKDGITIFMTTAYLDEAERCNRVAISG